jgi:tRNA wybutosine-synthesizing protein 5
MFNSAPAPEDFQRQPNMALEAFLRAARGAQPGEVWSAPHFRVPAQWNEDLGPNACLDPRHDLPPRIYARQRIFVYRNAGSEWHPHLTDETLTAQLLGRKAVSLFRLGRHNWDDYAKPIEANLHHTKNGYAFFPATPSITKLEGVLEAGDVVYIPPFWFHGIDPADDDLGITLARCFRTPLTRAASLQEPFIRDTMRRALRHPKDLPRVPYLLGVLGLSTLARARAHQQWREEDQGR